MIYKGPFKEVIDDDNHAFVRGERIAVCEKTFKIYSKAPYVDYFDLVEPHEVVLPQDMKVFDCAQDKVRSPKQTKGEGYNLTSDPSQCCDGDSCC